MHAMTQAPPSPSELSPSSSAFSRAKIRAGRWLLGFALVSASSLMAQAPDPAPAPAAPVATGGPAAQPAGNKKEFSLSRDGAGFDPGSEVMSWDGKNWNVNNNRIFEARFEKYLNAPEETSLEDRRYQAIISRILALLAPGNASKQNLNAAFHLLPQGSIFDIDARLCDSLADAVYSASSSIQAQDRLAAYGDAMEAARTQQYWNAKHMDAGHALTGAGSTTTSGNGKGATTQTSKQSFEDTSAQLQFTSRIAEIEAKMKANVVKQELSAIQTKIEFQALIVQFFLQRRFQHVLMATRFYRAIFTDGDTSLNLGKESKNLFEKSAGMPPTVGTLDSMANEALRDVREGVRTYEFLLQKNELESATKRLGEAFTVGEYVPEIRTLSRDKKRQALDFSRKSYQLISALEVKDYTLAEHLVTELGKVAKDFDASKPTGLIETSKVGAQMHLAKARNAALSGDHQTLEAELTAATELWPRNPQLAEVTRTIFFQGDTQAQTLLDFDQLVSQKNYRRIYDDSPRFIAASAQDPLRFPQLKKILDYMKTIEIAITQANAMAQQSNYDGAWETVEKISAQYPDDNKLSQTRADLTTQAADFVRTIRSAQDLEKKAQFGSSLALYLKARKMYPASGFANDGVDRLVKKILPAT
jgi:tetratricopeptide (TPR) repeat protein